MIFWGISASLSQVQYYLKCLAVENNNDVRITWEIPTSPPDFLEYRIYHTDNASPANFNLISIINNINTTSFIHINTNANQMPNLYFLKTFLISGDSIVSDTLKTIYLQVANPGDGDAELSWNRMHNPSIPSSANVFNIYKEYPLGYWNLIEITTALSCLHEISICHDSLSFRIEVEDNSGCVSVSNIDGGIFEDITKPPMPVIDSVSIEQSTGNSIVGWQPSQAGDTEGYLVYRYINTNWIIIDTVWGINNSIYIDQSSNSCVNIQAYALAAFDSCGNKSLGTFLIPQQTILLDNVLYDPCERTHTLTWTAYINMDPLITGYKVFVSENNWPFVLLSTLPAGEVSFTHNNLNTGTQYRYFIRAFNNSNNNTSSSCIKVDYAFQYRQPAFNYFANATVENNDHIRLKLFFDASATIRQVKIYRYDDNSGSFNEIDSYNTPTDDILIIDDYNVSVHKRFYRYRALLIDSCDAVSLQSNVVNSILLTAEMSNPGNIYLQWNEFTGWEGGIEAYNIYRIIDGILDPYPIATLPSGMTEYTDEIDALTTAGNILSYLVAAIEGEDNSLGFKEISYSNEAIVETDPRIYVPNAFRPDGINNIFKPVGIFMNQQNYSFRIYNRWGNMVFQTNSFPDGWNGTFKGKRSPGGVYIYHISFHSPEGKSFEKKGTFVLVR